MSAVATAGAAAWVVPEILTAKPAAGATLSGPATSPVDRVGPDRERGDHAAATTTGVPGPAAHRERR